MTADPQPAAIPRWRIMRRLRALEAVAHPPQPVVPADEFDRFVERWAELYESIANAHERLRKRVDDIAREHTP